MSCGCTFCLLFVPVSFVLPGMWVQPCETMIKRVIPWGGQSGELGSRAPQGPPGSLLWDSDYVREKQTPILFKPQLHQTFHTMELNPTLITTILSQDKVTVKMAGQSNPLRPSHKANWECKEAPGKTEHPAHPFSGLRPSE